jgi:hypothetical protein
VTLSTGFVTVPAGQFDGCQRLILCHFGSSGSASCAGSLSRWLKYVFACATHRFLLDRVSGLRLPDAAVYPRFSLLRTSRKTGGYAFTSVPEGQGLHLHGDEVTRLKVHLNLAVCPEAEASFRPTGRTPDLVVNQWPSDGGSSSNRDFLCLRDVSTTFCC